MPEWGGYRPGAGRKPKQPGSYRVSLSTRVSQDTSQWLRERVKHTGRTFGELIDLLVAFAQTDASFELLLSGPMACDPPEAAERGLDATDAATLVTAPLSEENGRPPSA